MALAIGYRWLSAGWRACSLGSWPPTIRYLQGRQVADGNRCTSTHTRVHSNNSIGFDMQNSKNSIGFDMTFCCLTDPMQMTGVPPENGWQRKKGRRRAISPLLNSTGICILLMVKTPQTLDLPITTASTTCSMRFFIRRTYLST